MSAFPGHANSHALIISFLPPSALTTNKAAQCMAHVTSNAFLSHYFLFLRETEFEIRLAIGEREPFTLHFFNSLPPRLEGGVIFLVSLTSERYHTTATATACLPFFS